MRSGGVWTEGAAGAKALRPWDFEELTERLVWPEQSEGGERRG